MKRTLISLIIAVLVAMPAIAHDFWLLPGNFAMQEPGSVKVEFLIGHGTEVEPWNLRWDRVVALRSLSRGGLVDQQATLVPQSQISDGGALVSLNEAGTHVIAFESYYGFSELNAGKFNDYVALEGLTPIIAYRERTDSTDTSGRELYSRRAKSIVQVGDTLTDQVLQPIGHTLEIVPLAHPYALGEDRRLPVQVLFRGVPLEGAIIDLTDLGSGDEPLASVRTDGEGKAIFSVPAESHWKLNVVWGVPNPGNARAEFGTIFCSLTFGYDSP